jgi:hypothetical protein
LNIIKIIKEDEYMLEKQTKGVVSIVSLFLGGILFTFIGFFKGYDIAIKTSKPAGAIGWTTSQEYILSCTYFPIIIGVSLIICSIFFSTVLFHHWINN